jgi:hypothetical protein
LPMNLPSAKRLVRGLLCSARDWPSTPDPLLPHGEGEKKAFKSLALRERDLG